jgi:hypothetical protein
MWRLWIRPTCSVSCVETERRGWSSLQWSVGSGLLDQPLEDAHRLQQVGFGEFVVEGPDEAGHHRVDLDLVAQEDSALDRGDRPAALESPDLIALHQGIAELARSAFAHGEHGRDTAAKGVRGLVGLLQLHDGSLAAEHLGLLDIRHDACHRLVVRQHSPGPLRAGGHKDGGGVVPLLAAEGGSGRIGLGNPGLGCCRGRSGIDPGATQNRSSCRRYAQQQGSEGPE